MNKKELLLKLHTAVWGEIWDKNNTAVGLIMQACDKKGIPWSIQNKILNLAQTKRASYTGWSNEAHRLIDNLLCNNF